jgi:hypothetical protein
MDLTKKLNRVWQSISRCSFEGKQKQAGENCEIGYEVRREAPVLAGVTETATCDIESTNFCCNSGEREEHDGRTQNRKRATI